MKHIHILGIGGTFMSGLAILAREAGYKVTGCDANCYPPISNLLQDKGIEWHEGYEDIDTALKADAVIVGNAMKRGIPVLEAVIEKGGNYTSGPQWLSENILSRYKVIAVSGTHGKTTTTCMLASILEKSGMSPGFLIGGVADEFGTSARLGEGNTFVIEADEYDSAFFDKRPKFMHYRPRVAIVNNLEYDHADIYPDLASIQKQFHYFLRTIPHTGLVIRPANDEALDKVFSWGEYSTKESFSSETPYKSDWAAVLKEDSGSSFQVMYKGENVAEVHWDLIGRFNVENALAAIAAAFKVGVVPSRAATILNQFRPVKRRLELKGKPKGVSIFDDFAHHPTAIAKTIDALKRSKKYKKVFAVIELGSYSMKKGIHASELSTALSGCDKAFILNPTEFSLEDMLVNCPTAFQILPNTSNIVESVAETATAGDAIVIMSNKEFDNIHQKIHQQISDD